MTMKDQLAKVRLILELISITPVLKSAQSDADAAIDILDTLIKTQGWQDISTYDYKGFPLVLLAGYITPSQYAQENGSKPFWEIAIGRCWHVNTKKFTGFLGQQPTHWMPLPKPPKEQADE